MSKTSLIHPESNQECSQHNFCLNRLLFSHLSLTLVFQQITTEIVFKRFFRQSKSNTHPVCLPNNYFLFNPNLSTL